MAKKISELTQLTGLATDDKVPIVDTSASATKYFNLSTLIDLIYPVDSIYISASATNPASLFGGTWTQLKDRFLLAAGDTYNAGTTGGNANHTISISEMPQHSHVINGFEGANQWGSGNVWFRAADGSTGNVARYATSSIVGGSQPFSILPPYTVVYVWQRIA